MDPMDSDAARLDAGEREEAQVADRDRDAAAIDRGRRVRLGLLGGLVATVVMTAFRMPISESLPPTAAFWARYVGGGDEDDYPLQALALHLTYGSLAGGVYGALCGSDRLPSTVVRERRGMLCGTAYGLLLSVFGVRVVLARLLGMDLEPDERLVFHAGHLVYGFTLGTWFGSKVGEATGE